MALAMVVLLVSALVFGTKALSKDSAKRYIVFQDDRWDLESSEQPNWITNESTIHFKVDLSEDFEKIQAERAEEAAKKQAAQTEKTVDNSTGGPAEESANNENPASSSTKDSAAGSTENATSDSTEDPSNTETSGSTEEPSQDAEEPPALEQPFDIQANGKTITPQKPADFKGIYDVSIPTKEDGDVKVTITFHKDNSWKIPEMSKSFTIKQDTIKPVVDVETHFQDKLFTDGEFTKQPVRMKIYVRDEHFKPGTDTISIEKDDTPYQLETQPNWKNNTALLTFANTGDYKVTIKAADTAGNVSDAQVVTFGIVQQGPSVKITNTGRDGYYNDSVELMVENQIPIWGATAEVKVNGKPESVTKNFTVKGKTATLNLSGDGVYQVNVTVKDRKNPDGVNLGENRFTIDTKKPELGFGGLGNGKVYNDSKMLAISVTDTNADENATLLKVLHNGQEKVFSGKEAFKKMELKDEGNYLLQLASTDKAGNTANEEMSLTIDKSNPELNISGVDEGQFYNTKKDVNFTVKDLTLDVGQTVLNVLKNGEAYKKEIPFTAYPDNKAKAAYTFTEEGSYELQLVSTDKAGHKEETARKFTIDATAPDITISPVDDGKEYNTEQNVAVSVSDLHLDQYQVTVKKNGEEIKASPLKPDGQTAKSEQVFKEDGVYEIHVAARDTAGNRKEMTKTFTIDSGAPEIDFSGVKDGVHYNSDKVGVTISVDDLTFKKDKTALEITRNGEKIEPELKWSIKNAIKWMLKGELTLQFKDEGVYHIKVSSEDHFGKKSSSEIGFTIDRTAPKVNISGIDNGSYIQNGQTVISVDETYYQTNNVQVTVTKHGKEEKVPFDSKAEHSELTLPFTEDGDYVIKVAAEDKAGNKATVQTIAFTVDTVKPAIQILNKATGEQMKNNAYHSKNQDVSIVVDEHNFSNNNVNINVTATNTVTNEKRKINIGEWQNKGETSKLSYEFKDEFEYTITVDAADAAGNKADTQSVTFTVDHTNPELSIDGIEDNHNYKSQGAVFTVRDTNIDLNETNLKVTRNGELYAIGDLQQVSKTKGELKFHFGEEGNYVVKLDSTDKAGRKTVHDPISFIIDSTKPVVKIEGVDHNSFNPKSKNVTMSVEEKNYQTNHVSLSVTKDGAPFGIGTFVTDKKPLSKHSYNFSKDGLYTIALKAEDKAGNGPVEVNRTFTIDKTKPAIDITGVDNDAYYNVDKPVSVTIRDVNLDVNRITVTRDGTRYAAGGFGVNGDTASLRHNFSKEGLYHITVEATDKAGNSFSKEIHFTIDKTKPVITPKIKGTNHVIKNGEFINEIFTPEFALDQRDDSIVSVELNGKNVGRTAPTASKEMKYDFKVLAKDKAGNEATISVSFTLDTTKPNLTITGVLAGFFKNNISPMVKYFDKYLDKGKTSVTLNGRPYENGMTLKNEGDYVLKAVVTDLAKNVSSRTIVFTIDKTAPAIKFNEPISNKYFKEDLIPKLLIKDLNAYDIISQTLDGEEYRLGDPITSEGKHVLFFEVKDKAGNIKKLSVEFILDKTAPKVIYEGVKSNETYYDSVRVAVHVDNPQDKIKSILVNGQLVNFDKTVDKNGTTVLTTKLSEISPYRIQVTAVDDAGNETKQEIPFEIAQKSALVKFSENKPLVAGSIFGLIALIGAGTVVAVRKRKEEVDE